jgi:hypothetical protein
LSPFIFRNIPNDMLCKRWRNTNDELVPGSFIFVPGFRDTKYQSKTKRGQMARFLKKYLSKNNKLCILLILEIQALKWCNIYLTDIWFKSYTWSKQIFWYKLSSFPPLKNTVLPRFRVSNVNIFFKTLYQIKAFNIFFIVKFTSWKYLIPFKNYTYKHTGKYLSWF